MQWQSQNFSFARPYPPPTTSDSDLELQLLGDPFYSDEYCRSTQERRLVVYFFGTTATGRLVRIRAYGQEPNMYSLAPEWLSRHAGNVADAEGQVATGPSAELNSMLRTIRDGLNETLKAYHEKHVKPKKMPDGREWTPPPPEVAAITMVRRKPIFFYHPTPLWMCLYAVRRPGDVTQLRKLLIEGVRTRFGDMPCSVYDCNIDFTSRTMIDNRIQMGGWVKISADSYHVCNTSDSQERPRFYRKKATEHPRQDDNGLDDLLRKALNSGQAEEGDGGDEDGGDEYGVPTGRRKWRRSNKRAATQLDFNPYRHDDDDEGYGSGDDIKQAASAAASSSSSAPVGDDITSLQIECNISALQSLPAVGVHAGNAPQRIVVTDIECAGRLGVFPEPKLDPVIVICSSVHILGDADRLAEAEAKRCFGEGLSRKVKADLKTIEKRSFDAGSDDGVFIAFYLRDIDVSKLRTLKKPPRLFSFDTEEAMLKSWASFIRWLRPEWLSGWNISQFDMVFLMERAKELKIGTEFANSGIPRHPLKLTKSAMSNKAHGQRGNMEVFYPGITLLDALQVDIRESQRRSYQLGDVAKEELGVGKDDVHHTEITPLYMEGGPEGRGRVVEYCLVDVLRSWQITWKRQFIVAAIEMSRTTGVSPNTVLQRGSTAKTRFYVLRKCFERGFVLDYLRDSSNNIMRDRLADIDDEEFDDKFRYAGALVINPVTGLHEWVLVLDYRSLYPSIIEAYNLCYSTQLRPSDLRKYDRSQYIVTPDGGAFLKNDVYLGILPEIERELMAKRDQTKKLMNTAYANGELVTANNLNNRQNAEKLVANGTYGVTASQYWLPNLAISAGTTSIGQVMIKVAQANALFVLRETETPFGRFPDTTVVYGDTDSIMINPHDVGRLSMQQRLDLGVWLSKRLSVVFRVPIWLNFEKIYAPYLLFGKKRYCGIFWTTAKEYDKTEEKGVESKRRDNCPWAASAVAHVIRILLLDRNMEMARDFARQQVAALYQHKVPLTELTITTKYGKKAEKYKNSNCLPAHLVVNNKIVKQEGEGAAFHLGDRIPFLIMPAMKGTRKNDRAQFSKYVEKDPDDYVDVKFYLDALKKMLTRIFDPLYGEGFTDKNIFKGEHTMERRIAFRASGAISKFVTRTKRDTHVTVDADEAPEQPMTALGPD